MENVLKQCYFCEGWFPSDQVEEIDLWRHPSGTYAKEYLCKNCIADRASKFSRLVRAASEAFDKPENFKEIEISDGDLKVRLVRFTPIPGSEKTDESHYG